MKIAMIGHKRIPGREGGVEVVVEELATRLAVQGHEVTVFNRKKKGYHAVENYKGVKIITIPTIELKKTDAVVYSFLASVRVLFGRYDVVHYHALGPSVLLIIPHLFHIKTVVTVHGLNYKTLKWKGFGAKFIFWGEKITVKYADEIITLSNEQQKYFWNKYKRKTNLIPNGAVLLDSLPSKIIDQKWGLKKKSYVLFLSRIVPGKGLEILIDAYKRTNIDKPLIIAGDSDYVDDFQQRIYKSASEDERIEFIGFASGETLMELYSNTALFVFPSEAEGMPICLLEALSYNAPCLVSDIPENLEVGGEYVQSFQTGSASDLYEKLINCIDNMNILFPKESRSYIREKYDWDKVTRQTLGLYGE